MKFLLLNFLIVLLLVKTASSFFISNQAPSSYKHAKYEVKAPSTYPHSGNHENRDRIVYEHAYGPDGVVSGEKYPYPKEQELYNKHSNVGGIGHINRKGIPGADGHVGYPGHPGESGNDGYPGYPGTHEIIYERGNPGYPGHPGFRGMQGEPGRDGRDGMTGDTGDPGERGPEGSTGAPGPEGSTGAPGPEGSTGAPGPEGSTGAPGPEGSTGAPGPEGSTGAPGPVGAKGDGVVVCETAENKFGNYGNLANFIFHWNGCVLLNFDTDTPTDNTIVHIVSPSDPTGPGGTVPDTTYPGGGAANSRKTFTFYCPATTDTTTLYYSYPDIEARNECHNFACDFISQSSEGDNCLFHGVEELVRLATTTPK